MTTSRTIAIKSSSLAMSMPFPMCRLKQRARPSIATGYLRPIPGGGGGERGKQGFARRCHRHHLDDVSGLTALRALPRS
jgi:hypothetical protein